MPFNPGKSDAEGIQKLIAKRKKELGMATVYCTVRTSSAPNSLNLTKTEMLKIRLTLSVLLIKLTSLGNSLSPSRIDL